MKQYKKNTVDSYLLWFFVIFAKKRIMIRLKQVVGHYLDMSEYGIDESFDVYELGNYDFKDNLDFGESAGVYIFTKRDCVSKLNPSFGKEMYPHTLIYCGETEEIDKRFYSHFHADDIIKEGADRISIRKCKNKEEATNLEKKLLETLKFPVNKKENDTPKYPDIKKVWEAF